MMSQNFLNQSPYTQTQTRTGPGPSTDPFMTGLGTSATLAGLFGTFGKMGGWGGGGGYTPAQASQAWFSALDNSPNVQTS